MYVCDLKPSCVCLQRREGVAGGFQLLSLGHQNSVFGHHHSSIEICTHSREREFKAGMFSRIGGKMFVLIVTNHVSAGYLQLTNTEVTPRISSMVSNSTMPH